MKLNEIDIKTRILAKLPPMYGYHKLINSKYHSYTNQNNSSTNPLYKLINSKYQFPLSTPTQLLSYIFPF